MTPQEMLEQMIDKATLDFLEIAKAEEDDDYSDAMQSMERTEAQGFVDGLSSAYYIVYDKEYVSPVSLDDINE
jgi:predicted transcriptional regulator